MIRHRPRAEEEEEEGERRGSPREYGAVEAWTDEVVDGIGVASPGCVLVSGGGGKLGPLYTSSSSSFSSIVARTDRFFFSEVNRESRGVLEYAGVNVSKLIL